MHPMPSLNMNGNKTIATKAHRKNTISKMWTSTARYFAELCITTKLKPEIIIKIIETALSERLGKFFCILHNFGYKVLPKTVS